MIKELLAPVGNMECLFAAINAGSDAVYLSGINFGARSFAGNFTREELVEAIKTCHLYGVKVYVTVNTLIYDQEVERFMEYIDFLHKNNVDAVIMQDIGMIDLVRKTYPNLDIHISTQAHIHNLEGVKLCEKLGAKRVILARETPISLIKEIKKNTNIEIEIFIHGALCMCYSGQCLMSALIGNRSANRGCCAQICRQPYNLEIDNKIVNKDNYLLSTKDLNTLDYIDEIVKSGVDSLKIEGRMKRKEYVYLVTSLYRKALDNYSKYKETKITDEDIINLKKIFNRKFTKGFLFNEDNDLYTNPYRPNHIGINIGKVIDYKSGKVFIKLLSDLSINDGIRILGSNDIGFIVTTMYKNKTKVNKALKNDIISIPLKDRVIKGCPVVKTTDYNELKEIQDKININKKIKIKGSCILEKGKPIILSISDYKNEVKLSSDYIIEPSKNAKTTISRIEEQLRKLGNTIYEFDKLDIKSDDDIFVPINKLNELRRMATDLLNQKRIYKTNYKKEEYKITVKDFPKEKKKSILINSYEDYLKVQGKYDKIYVESLELLNKINDKKCILKLSRVLEHLKDYDNHILVGELGSIYKYSSVETDFSLNVTNCYSVALLHSMGVKKITLSLELNYKQIKQLVENYEQKFKAHPNLEVIVEANVEAMVCKYNMLKKYNKKEGYLIDRFNNRYKLKVKDNLMYIYDYKKRKLKDDYYDIGINSIRVNIN